MKNSNLNNEYLDDEIDLLEVLRTLLNSKKLIFIVTLAFSLLAFIYTTQKELKYQSTVFIELGYYDLLSGEKKLIEPIETLIEKLKVNLIYKQRLYLDSNELNFDSIEDQLLRINYTSISPEFSENVIKEAIIFSQESHAEILSKLINSFSEKIKAKDNQIEFLKNSIESQQESEKLEISEKIIAIDNQILALEANIKQLLRLITEEENNLLLLESSPAALLQRTSSSPTLQQIIYSYKEKIIGLKNQIQNLLQEKETLELQVESILEGEFTSKELFEIQQEKETLELQTKLINDQINSTQPIRELETKEIKPRQLLIILIGTILGFIFSVFTVFIRQTFYKEHN